MKRCWIVGFLLLLAVMLAGCGDDGWEYDKITAEFDQISTYYKIIGYTGEETELTVPSRYKSSPVVFIGKEAFAGNETVTKITLPEGITELRDRAFADCPNLTEVRIPTTVIRMGEDLFTGSDNVVLTVYPDSMGEEYAIEAGVSYQVVE